MVNENYNYLKGELSSTAGYCIPEYAFPQYLEKEVISYSQAPGFEFERKAYMVGALARMNLNGDRLYRDTRKDLGKYLHVFPSYNVFYNNISKPDKDGK